MKHSLFLIAILLLLGVVAPVSHAQQTSTPDDGDVVNGVYTNRFFGLSVTYPKDWVVHGEATNTRLKEIGKGATSSGAMSAASTEVILKNTYQLLTAFQYPMGAVVEVNPSFMLIAERVNHAPGIVNGRDYLLYVRPMMIKTGVIPVNDEPSSLLLGGHKFFRQNSRMQVNGMSLEQSIVITVIKGFAIAFILSGKDQPSIDEMFKAAGTLRFAVSPATSPRKPSPKSPPSKSKPRRRN